MGRIFMLVVMWSIRVFVGWFSGLVVVLMFLAAFEAFGFNTILGSSSGERFPTLLSLLFAIPAGLYVCLEKSWWEWLKRLLLSMPTTVKSSIKSTVVGTAKVVDEIQDSVAEMRQDRREDENQDYALAMQEVENENPDPGLWARAFVESDGDETKQKVVYLKLRVEQLGRPS